MVDKGWGILGQEEALGRPPELTGHLDLRAWHSDHGEAIIDLKTGAQIGAAWLQVGGYLTPCTARQQVYPCPSEPLSNTAACCTFPGRALTAT